MGELTTFARAMRWRETLRVKRRRRLARTGARENDKAVDFAFV